MLTSTSATKQRRETRVIEVAIKGPGEFTVGVVDPKGRLLLRKRIVISGDPAIEGKSRLPLVMQTRNGEVAVVPVLIQRKSPRQQITFAGRETADFTAQRCRELKVAATIIEKAVRAAATAMEQIEDHVPSLFIGTLRSTSRHGTSGT
jgi:hypothetical protein